MEDPKTLIQVVGFPARGERVIRIEYEYPNQAARALDMNVDEARKLMGELSQKIAEARIDYYALPNGRARCARCVEPAPSA